MRIEEAAIVLGIHRHPDNVVIKVQIVIVRQTTDVVFNFRAQPKINATDIDRRFYRRLKLKKVNISDVNRARL